MVRDEPGKFSLTVPLDASGVEGIEAGKVRVLVQDSSGKVTSQTVEVDGKGQGAANFRFEELRGGLHVVVGPADASEDELLGLQTITMDVAARRLKGAAEMRLEPIRIPPYYWWWWRRWCRTFTIHGVVRCADGRPVPGAQVCAFDVDWWWWWSSRQQIACATTDINGAFSMTFRWCCGWWPWWWWRQRFWQLEPALLERVAPVLRRDPALTSLLRASPQPSFEAFEKLLLESGELTRPLPRVVDPAVLPDLREQLIKHLPASVELEQLRVWPWWPWHPWWDCAPDVIFKVTQDCQRAGTVIVDESVWNARFDIPTDLDVTLVANSQACCLPTGHGCDAGTCSDFTTVCSFTVDTIGGNVGAASAAATLGYQDPGAGDRPFGGDVVVESLAECLDAVDYYEIEWTTNPGVEPWNALPPAAAGTFYRRYYSTAGGGSWSPDIPFAASMIDGHLVYKSLPRYEAENPPADWGSTRFWVVNRDELFVWRTAGIFVDDTYYLRIRGWSDGGGGTLTGGDVLKLCGDDTEDAHLVVRLDNRTEGPGPLDLHGNPCGGNTIHTCTDEPDTAIVSITVLDSGGVVKGAIQGCGNVEVEPGDKLQIDFVAHDPDGHLSHFGLSVYYDVNLVRNLLTLPSATLAASAGPLLGVSPAAQLGPDYAAARTQSGFLAPIWEGGAYRFTVDATGPDGAFPTTCCYLLELAAFKRTIVSCNSNFPHRNYSQTTFTVIV